MSGALRYYFSSYYYPVIGENRTNNYYPRRIARCSNQGTTCARIEIGHSDPSRITFAGNEPHAMKRNRKCCEQRESDDSSEIAATNEPVCEMPRYHSLGGVLTARQILNVPFQKIHSQIRLADSFNFHYPSFDGCPDWAKPLMFAEHQAGFQEAWLCSLIRHLPVDLAVALRGAVLSQLIIEKHTQVMHQRIMQYSLDFGEQHFPLFHQHEPTQSEQWLYDRFGGNDDELAVFDRASIAICRETFVPSSRRRTEYYANPALCRIVGLPIEELLARVGAADLPEHMSPLDHLCGMIEGVICSLNNSWMDVVRWTWPGRPAVLVERTTRNFFNRQGRLWQRLAYHRVLAPAEYDARCAATDSGGYDGGGWDSLRRAIGDNRSGAALLADAEGDRQQQSIEGLVSTPEGRATLSRLAEEVVRRCDGRTRVARRILEEYPEVEAWARDYLASPWRAHAIEQPSTD